MNVEETKAFAKEIRLGALTALKSRGFGHVGGSFSIADVLAVLYKDVMNYDPKDPHLDSRDKLVCSKGHAGPAVYGALAAVGFFPKETLKTLNQPGTILPSHCDRRLAGIDATTGSLGQGTSEAVGMALGDKLQGRKSNTYLIVGDGELNEGQCWEAAMFTAGKKLNNLTWIIDWNKRQLDGSLEEILPSFDFEEKFRAFGFDAVTVDGHDYEAMFNALTKQTDKPKAIVLDTLKAKGIKEAEESTGNHSMTVDTDTWDRWIKEVEEGE